MKHFTLLLIVLCACTNHITYEEHTDAASKHVLSNGLTILMKPNPDTGLVAIDFMLKRSIAADADTPGIGYLTNRLLLTGTTQRTREQITHDIENAGGRISARTYAEYAEILIEVPSDKVSVALDVLSNIILHPTFPPAEFEKEKQQHIDELKSKRDDPNIRSEELFMSVMYANHPYEHPIDGYTETVSSILRNDAIAHFKTWYQPQNMIISIAGNIKEKETLRAIEQLFGELPRGKTIDAIPRPYPRIIPTQNSEHMDLESFYINYGYQLTSATHPDFIKLRMANAILGSGSGSRLFYELRDKRALAYSVFSIAPSIRTNGFLKIGMITRPEVLNESLAGIQEQVERLKKEPVSEDELHLVKQKVRGFFLLDHQKTADQANYLGLYELQGLGYQYDVEYPQKLSAVTSDDVIDVANKYFNNSAITIVGPFNEAAIE